MHSFEFSLNVFTEFAEFSEKNICHYSKRVQTCHPATSCVRDQNATTVPARHMWEARSLNWAKFMLKWFIRFAEFSEFLFHLGKTQLFSPYKAIWPYFLQFQSLLDFCGLCHITGIKSDSNWPLFCTRWRNLWLDTVPHMEQQISAVGILRLFHLEYCFIHNWKVVTVQQKDVVFQLRVVESIYCLMLIFQNK